MSLSRLAQVTGSLDYADREPAGGLTLVVFRRRGDGWEMVQDASL